jgi:YggT family protein
VAAFLIGLVNLVVGIITIILIAKALMSWLPLDPWHPARRLVDQLAEPFLRPFRGLIPPAGMFDLTVLVALIVVQILGRLLVVLIAASL